MMYPMYYSVPYKCTPSVAQHTLRGIADRIDEFADSGLELVDIRTEKDLTVPEGLLTIILIYRSKPEPSVGALIGALS